jgi:hypothetical protein
MMAWRLSKSHKDDEKRLSLKKSDFLCAAFLYGREEIGDELCAGPHSENDDGHAASSREDHRAASNMREKSETPDDDSSETPRGMIDNRLRF